MVLLIMFWMKLVKKRTVSQGAANANGEKERYNCSSSGKVFQHKPSLSRRKKSSQYLKYCCRIRLSSDRFYLIKITNEYGAKDFDDENSFGSRVKRGIKHLEGNFLERVNDRHYRLSKKKAIFYTESVKLRRNKERKLADEEFVQITKYIEESGFTGSFSRKWLNLHVPFLFTLFCSR